MVICCRKGFTLLEVIVVVAIIATIVAISFPAIISWRENTLYRDQAQTFLGAMFQAKSLAVSSNLQARVEFDIGNSRYRVTQGDRAEKSTTWDTVVTDWSSVPASIALRSGNDCAATADISLEFCPNGTATVNDDATSTSGYICVMDPSNLTEKYKVGVASTIAGRPSIEK